MTSKHAKDSTVKQGNRFRDLVASLLRTRYPDARTEVHVRHKDVDIVFSYQHLGKTLRFGVECKDYDRPLTKDQIATKIQPDYSPLVCGGELSDVLIVAKFVLSWLPTPLTAAMIAIAMPAAMRPYSIAVAPDSSFRNFATIAFMFDPTLVATSRNGASEVRRLS